MGAVRTRVRNLSVAALEAAQCGAQHFATEEYALFYVNAGAAVELAVKAALARINPHFDLFALYGDLARAAVSDAQDDAELAVQRLLSVATSRLRDLGADQVDNLRDAAARAAENERDKPDPVFVTCPVCESPARGVGALTEEGDAEAEDDHGDIIWHWIPDLTIWIEQFACGVCGLRLDAAQLERAGVPRSVSHPTAHPYDFPDLYS
jgi:hypothetical protein